MSENTLSFETACKEISREINEQYPFNCDVSINPQSPYNSFIVTIDKLVWKKFKAPNPIEASVQEYFKKNWKISAKLKIIKKEMPLVGQNAKIYYTITIS